MVTGDRIPDGTILRVPGELPGGTHDTAADRIRTIPGDKGYPYHEETQHQ